MNIKAQEIKKAEHKTQEILGMLHYDTTSLTHALIKAFRAGMAKESAEKAVLQIKQAADDCLAVYHAAVAQPEPKMNQRPVVEL